MAVSSYPTPADAGILFIILSNTAMSISIIKEIIRSILHNLGIHVNVNAESWEEVSVEHSRKAPSESYMAELRTRMPTILCTSKFLYQCQDDRECSICLTGFQPSVKINRLPCGHVFHNVCIDKWLNYWNTTCPLCRDSLIA